MKLKRIGWLFLWTTYYFLLLSYLMWGATSLQSFVQEPSKYDIFGIYIGLLGIAFFFAPFYGLNKKENWFSRHAKVVWIALAAGFLLVLPEIDLDPIFVVPFFFMALSLLFLYRNNLKTFAVTPASIPFFRFKKKSDFLPRDILLVVTSVAVGIVSLFRPLEYWQIISVVILLLLFLTLRQSIVKYIIGAVIFIVSFLIINGNVSDLSLYISLGEMRLFSQKELIFSDLLFCSRICVLPLFMLFILFFYKDKKAIEI